MIIILTDRPMQARSCTLSLTCGLNSWHKKCLNQAIIHFSLCIWWRATPPVGYCPSTASFSVRPHCKNARRDRCQEYHNCFPFGGLEETTKTSSNYVDEDYPARPEIKHLSMDEAITVAQNRMFIKAAI